MKKSPEEFMERFASATRPVDYHISPESVERFLSDPKLWPVEVWMRVRDHEGREFPKIWEMYPDPVDPEPEGHSLVREWRIRPVPLGQLGRIAYREGPARIVENPDPADSESRFIVTLWLAAREETG